MAFNSQYLSRLAGGGGFALWHFRTTDTKATMNTAGYFSGDAVNMLEVGDVIIAQQVDAVAAPATITSVDLMNVLSNDGTTVDVSDGTSVVVTDTD